MLFRIISRKNNSYRVRSGIVTFEMRVIQDSSGKSIVVKPRDIYFSDKREFNELATAILEDYSNFAKTEREDVTLWKKTKSMKAEKIG